jgi:hypothetical protein
LSDELNDAAAQNSLGICLERGIGVHKNELLAAQYYQRAAQQGHPDGANNIGFCLDHGRGVEQNIEMASEYYKFAADCGHSEAKLNHNRCLRLLDQWKPPDRSSEIVSHSPSVDYLSKIFVDFLKDPTPLNDDNRRLLNSFDKLRMPTAIPVISFSSKVEMTEYEIESRDSSVVKLSLDSQSNLSVIKTSQNGDHAKLISREAFILKTLKHPLIVKLERDISDTGDHNLSIVTDLVGNGSLANHLPPTKWCLSGAKPNHENYRWNRSCDALSSLPKHHSPRVET